MMKSISILAFILPAVYGLSDDLTDNSFTPLVASRLVTGGSVVPMGPNHPALGSRKHPTSNDPNAHTASVRLNENTDTISTGTRFGTVLFETYSTGKFIKTLKDLPVSGIANPIPWPSEYWPSYKDGINVRTDPSQQTAVEKYAQAFNLQSKTISDEISKISGVDAWSTNQRCQSDDDCQSSQEQAKCAVREGTQQGYCVPSWYGICHAWAPASIMEPEPRCPVNYNGVQFGVMDLKGLITQLYDGTGYGTVFAGSRCNAEQPQTDQYGRFQDNECKDATPDFVHLALTNMLGRFNKSILADVTATSQVWNQPILSYQILATQQYSASDAAGMVSEGQTTYTFNTNAVYFHYYKTQMNYISEGASEGPISGIDIVSQYTKTKTYEYILELDGSGVIIGGEWINESKSDHPDFMWMPTSRPTDDTTVANGIRYDAVRKLVAQSSSCTSS